MHVCNVVLKHYVFLIDTSFARFTRNLPDPSMTPIYSNGNNLRRSLHSFLCLCEDDVYTSASS